MSKKLRILAGLMLAFLFVNQVALANAEDEIKTIASLAKSGQLPGTNGVGLGSTFKEVVTAMGEPEETTEGPLKILVYKSGTLNLLINAEGVVAAVTYMPEPKSFSRDDVKSTLGKPRKSMEEGLLYHIGGNTLYFHFNTSDDSMPELFVSLNLGKF